MDTVSAPTTSTGSIVLGCSVAIISSCIQSLGITLQRKSHLLKMSVGGRSRANTHTHTPGLQIIQQQQQQQQIHYHNHNYSSHHQYQRYKRNMWLFGFMLFIVANVLGSLIQITTLPLIILSPLQSIGLIFNSILSCLLLPGETFTRKLGVGTITIAIGAFTIAYNGNSTPIEDPHPPKDIDERFNLVMSKLLSGSFLSWFITTFIMITILLVFNYAYLDKKLAKYNDRKSLSLSKDKLVGRNKYQFIKGFNYGIISGTLTAHTFLFAKSIIDVIVETILNKQSKILPITNAAPYLLLVFMLATIGFQLTAFNLGLAQISTSILYPLCFLVYNLINLINDIIFNSLLSKHIITINQFVWIIIGLVFVLFGVIIISWDSAFGKVNEDNNVIYQDQTIEQDEDAFIYQKFPYNQQLSPSYDHINEHTELLRSPSTNKSATFKQYSTIDSTDSRLSSSTAYTNTNFSSLATTEEPSNVILESDQAGSIHSPRVTTPKRILSFEQSQLLNSLDV
ncbi:uncharacterized protein RJT21DRAFT_11177 [Scheffersomyces amazonensis]|uniref:uncharacterized protein n=1 Tax=Scheffersomyces amazonensis TaxID=1078765 RepID=UPI00315D04E1